MARDFNGTTDRIDYASVADTAGIAQTFSAWLWLDAAGAANQFLWIAHNAADNGFGTLFLISATTNTLYFYQEGSPIERRISVEAVSTAQWVHVLFTWAGSTTATTIHIYINGVECTYGTATNGSTLTAATGQWSLGGRIYDDARNLNGKLAGVGWWNRVLTADEIAGLAKGFSPLCYLQGLKFAPDLDGLFGPNNPLGGVATPDGTSISPHPRIIYPSRRRVQVRGAAVGVFDPSASLWQPTIEQPFRDTIVPVPY